MYNGVPVKIELMYPNVLLPVKGTPLRAYYDIHSLEDVELICGEVTMVRTGLKVQPAHGYFIDVRPRSGLAKYGVTINNSPGLIDEDYGGELLVELIYHSRQFSIMRPFVIKAGDRIAQIGVMPVHHIEWLERQISGTGGFGSTGA